MAGVYWGWSLHRYSPRQSREEILTGDREHREGHDGLYPPSQLVWLPRRAGDDIQLRQDINNMAPGTDAISIASEDVIASAPALRPGGKADSTASQADKPEALEESQSGWLRWHEPGTSADEKRLLFKLDWFLLSFSCLTYFIKQVRCVLFLTDSQQELVVADTPHLSSTRTMSQMPTSQAWKPSLASAPATSSAG